MKGKVFIAWSAVKNDDSCNNLAIDIKNKLVQHDYTGIVGGMSRGASGLHVGATVLKELNQCNQAIFLMQKKESGSLSSNVLFEFGYALSLFDPQKVHVFFIDIDANDESIPTDIQGIWAEFVKSEKHPDLASYIVDKFLAIQPHNYIIKNNKMALIYDYYNYQSIINTYDGTTTLSEPELAQYILFFSQATYMFNDEIKAKTILEELMRRLENRDKKLTLAIRFALHYIDIFIQIKNDNNSLYLTRKDFRRKKDSLERIKKDVESLENDDFSQWFLMLLNDSLNYIHILYASSPNISTDKALNILNKSINYANICLALCNDLENNNHKNANELLVQLYKAYMYRNLYTAFSVIPEKKDEAYIQLKLSCETRMLLNEDINILYANTLLSDNFEMEYYLALSEYLKYIKDEDERIDYKEACEEYIKKVEYEKNFFTNRIKQFLSEF